MARSSRCLTVDPMCSNYLAEAGAGVACSIHSDVEPDYGEARTVRTGRVTLTSTLSNPCHPSPRLWESLRKSALSLINKMQPSRRYEDLRILQPSSRLSRSIIPAITCVLQDTRIKTHKNDGSGLFQADATFKECHFWLIRYILFQSVNFTAHYIRHRGFMLYIEQGNGDLYQNDCTFTIGPPAWRK